ncbi:pectin methylesterase [Colletotrichum truncatum]|uniref:Pectin methylesterase n=1 Tax=Colletotrichum truncatum TaxID=5467 RepID=A0ACC3YYB3_COLTU|nr:pectin methylesterase [Colletotrichum truncatum]KAF6782112.1 pectin methylesterase [Colletotrichum truncatum]
MVALLRTLALAAVAVAVPLEVGVSLGTTDAAPQCSGDKFSQTRPPRNAVVVDASGKQPNSFPTVNEAVAALKNVTDEQSVFIYPGIYEEQVRIPAHLGPITIRGYTCDSRTYAGNQVTLTGKLNRQVPNITSNDGTATLRIWTPNVKLYNLNVANTAGQQAKNGQALAISAQKTNFGAYACKFTGYQDTVYANVGRQIYAQTYINGAVDFIFGLNASAWFEGCDLEVIGKGWVTASGRDSAQNPAWFVFNKTRVFGDQKGLAFLGRPWRTFARVLFQYSDLSDVVQPAGWAPWDATSSLANVVFNEYKNTGLGAAGQRANFSSQIDAPVKAETVLGKGFDKEWWVDKSYL